jgi:hypothetical protein
MRAQSVRLGVGVSHGLSDADSYGSASERRRPAFDLGEELQGLIERAGQRAGGMKRLAGLLDAAPSTVRDWLARPERFPLAKLAALLDQADPDDPFLHRFVEVQGFRLVPQGPTAEQLVEDLVEGGYVALAKARPAVTHLEGALRKRRHPNQGDLWGGTE